MEYPYFLVHSSELEFVPSILKNGFQTRTMGRKRNTYPVFASILMPGLQLAELRWYREACAFVIDPAVLKRYPYKVYGHMGFGKQACKDNGKPPLLEGEGNLEELPDLSVLENHLNDILSRTDGEWGKSYNYGNKHEITFCHTIPAEFILAVMVQIYEDDTPAKKVEKHLQKIGADVPVIRVRKSGRAGVPYDNMTSFAPKEMYDAIVKTLESGIPTRTDLDDVPEIIPIVFDGHMKYDVDSSDNDSEDDSEDDQSGGSGGLGLASIGLFFITVAMAIIQN